MCLYLHRTFNKITKDKVYVPYKRILVVAKLMTETLWAATLCATKEDAKNTKGLRDTTSCKPFSF